MMITPANHIPLDDSQNSEADDQQSQKDIHSNGLDESGLATDKNEEPDTEMLQQAFDASKPAYTLASDKGIADKKE